MYPLGYNVAVYAIRQTIEFAERRASLRDLRSQIAIARRLTRAAAGILGDVKPLGNGLSELQVDVGAGYRLYFTIRKRSIALMLCGGDKHSQRVDIRRTRTLAEEVRNANKAQSWAGAVRHGQRSGRPRGYRRT